MSTNATDRLAARHHKMLAMRGETLRKPLAEAIGQAVERGIVLAKLTKQDVAFRMGYEDQSALSRWISGAETPQFARLWAIEELRGPLVIALAELAECVVETIVKVKRSA